MVPEAMLEAAPPVVQRQTLPAIPVGRSSRACLAFGSNGRHPMPYHCSPSSFEHAHCAARVVRPPWAPRVKPLVRLYCPGLSVRGGPMQVDDATNRGLIPLLRKARPLRRCCPHLRGEAASPIPSNAEMRKRTDHRFIFKTDRAGGITHEMRHRQTLGMHGVLVVAHLAEKLDHALRTRRNLRPY